MKALYFFGILSVLAFSCAQNKEVAKTSALRMEENQDSTEYKLIIIDNNFDLWYKNKLFTSQRSYERVLPEQEYCCSGKMG